jgi:energy-coupling factor transporter ATP-binding protein EcfA2
MATLRTEGLTKTYGDRTVVRSVDLDVTSGEVVGLLGPNGAGKTTTFSMVVGLWGLTRVVCCSTIMTSRPIRCTCGHAKGIGYLPQEALHLQRPHGGAEHPRHSRDVADFGRGAAQSSDGIAGLSLPVADCAIEGLRAFRRRAAARGDHARARESAEIHAARRAVCGIDPIAVGTSRKSSST